MCRSLLGGVMLLVSLVRPVAAAPDAPAAGQARPTRVEVIAMSRPGGDGARAMPAAAPVIPPISDQGADAGGDALLGEALNRLRFELLAAGLPAADAEHAADYVVALAHVGDRLVAEVHATRPSATAPALRRVDLATTADQDPASVAAIRAVELLRATILMSAPAPDTPAPAPTTAVAAARPAPDGTLPLDVGRPFVGGFGLTVFQSLRGLNTGVGLGGRFEARLHGRLNVRLMAIGPAIGRDQQVAGGSLSLLQMAGGAGIGYALGGFHGRRPTLSLTGGFYFYSFDSHPTSGAATSASGTVPFGSLGVGLPLVSWGPRSLWLQVDAVFTQPSLHVTVGDTDAGRTGRPLILVGVLLDYLAALHKTR